MRKDVESYSDYYMQVYYVTLLPLSPHFSSAEILPLLLIFLSSASSLSPPSSPSTLTNVYWAQENMPIKLGMMEINADLCVAVPAESGEEELKADLKCRVRNSVVVSKEVHDKIESIVGTKQKVRFL